MRSLVRCGQRAIYAASILSCWTLAAMAQTAAPAAPAAVAPAAAAAAAAVPKIDSGDTAWMLTSVALVLLMTIPGLALFYGGMVRKMNVLATVMQSFAVTCLVTVLWAVMKGLAIRLRLRGCVRLRWAVENQRAVHAAETGV